LQIGCKYKALFLTYQSYFSINLRFLTKNTQPLN
jgi:hypothetical protein